MQDPLLSSSERELRAHIESVLSIHYELDREIGRGGMGIVYRGRDRRLKRTVAIKVLPPELGFRSEIRSRFLREAETAAQLSHPNIVPIYSVGEQDNLVFFVMACIDGENIAHWIREHGPMGIDESRRILRDVADALHYAHSHGVVHRDIKPDNIILDAESGRPMVTDFGIARAVTDTDSRLTATGIAIGTPAFMSPEQSMGDREIDGRSDLYSLGVVGYQMLCGELPFNASNTPSMLMKHISEIPQPIGDRRPDLPHDLDRAIMLLLEKDPADRFPSAEALVVALDTGDVERYEPDRSRRDRVREEHEMVRRAPLGTPGPSYDTLEEYLDQPSDEEVRRWHAPKVLEFRRRLALFIPVNVVILVFALLTDVEFMFFSLLWSVYIAVKYSSLWSEGYDWRDVFRQPRHRTLIDLTSEAIDEIGALADPDKRREIREKARRRRLAAGRMPTPASPLPGATVSPREPAREPAGDAPGGGVVERAARDRDEVIRLVNGMAKADRERVMGVPTSARELYNRIEVLARMAARAPAGDTGAMERIDREIRQLEDEANPLDTERSDARVRRLAFLKRQRRAQLDVEERGDEAQRKLEECSLALHNIRLDVARLRAGTESAQHVTLLAERAISLAREVDGALTAADDVRDASRADARNRAR